MSYMSTDDKDSLEKTIINSAPYDIQVLLEMLRYKRPHGSHTENYFVKKYIADIPGMMGDGFGNLYLRIGDNPTTMWSCHTDTVHRTEGMQGVIFHKDCLIVERDPRDELREPLGADDAVGIWIMRNMIDKGIEGLYVFHRGEEKGGLGSAFISEYNQQLLSGITHAIAFDRAGDTDIITHQFGGRCCSDEFAIHLADILNSRDVELTPCSGGVFTDTANYTDLIPECTNVSVGYEDEHTPNEMVDLFYLTNLMDSILKADFTNMPVYRIEGTDDEDDDGDAPFGYERWNHVESQVFSDSYAHRKNKANTWLNWDDLWHLYGAGGPQLLIQCLLDLGVTEQDIDNAWENLGDKWDEYDV